MRSILVFLIAAMTSVAAMAQTALDSLEYSVGYVYIQDMLTSDTLMTTPSDRETFLRGFESTIGSSPLKMDENAKASYYLGMNEAVLMSESYTHRTDDKKPLLDCMLAGLEKVATGKVELPADTAEAMAFMMPLKGVSNSSLDPETRCRWYNYFGLMKAFAPVLQEYIDLSFPDQKFVADRQAYASGMRDGLILSRPTEVPFELGRNYAVMLSLNLGGDYSESDLESLVAGVKAALGLGDALLTDDEIATVLASLQLSEPEAETVE